MSLFETEIVTGNSWPMVVCTIARNSSGRKFETWSSRQLAPPLEGEETRWPPDSSAFSGCCSSPHQMNSPSKRFSRYCVRGASLRLRFCFSGNTQRVPLWLFQRNQRFGRLHGRCCRRDISQNSNRLVTNPCQIPLRVQPSRSLQVRPRSTSSRFGHHEGRNCDVATVLPRMLARVSRSFDQHRGQVLFLFPNEGNLRSKFWNSSFGASGPTGHHKSTFATVWRLHAIRRQQTRSHIWRNQKYWQNEECATSTNKSSPSLWSTSNRSIFRIT